MLQTQTAGTNCLAIVTQHGYALKMTEKNGFCVRGAVSLRPDNKFIGIFANNVSVLIAW